MEIKGISYDDSSYNVWQEIDLVDLFGVDDIPRDIAESLGGEIIDAIISNAKDGKSNTGKSLKGYDEDYIDSDEFKAAGKSASEVNMTLFGDMLSQMDILEYSNGVLKIGWTDPLQQKKAYAHMTGFKGHPTLQGKAKREFFGANQKMLEELSSKYSINDDSNKKNSDTLKALDVIALAQSSQAKRDSSLLIDFFTGFNNG